VAGNIKAKFRYIGRNMVYLVSIAQLGNIVISFEAVYPSKVVVGVGWGVCDVLYLGYI
jgi:hypothetical protein